MGMVLILFWDRAVFNGNDADYALGQSCIQWE